VTCENHLRVIATGRLTSTDGRLDETLPGMHVNLGTAMIGGSALPVASAVATLERDALRGSYAPSISPEQCFLSLQFNMTLSTGVFSGSFIESIGSVPCGVKDPNSAVLGRDAAIFHCPGDDACWSEPSVAVVIEADTCDGIGAQLTSSAHEDAFARSGDVITRYEEWGCGCAFFPSFVMAWSPRSPLELRLCEHDSRNVCLAACSGDLRYDISTAFRVTGASTFRFVD
jgi:hypothetical protein